MSESSSKLKVTGHPMVSNPILRNGRWYVNGWDITNKKVCDVCKISIGLIEHIKCSKISCNGCFNHAQCTSCDKDIVDDRDLYFPFDLDYEYDKYFHWDSSYEDEICHSPKS